MNEPIRLAFVGDIMCGDSFSLLGRGTAAMIDLYGRRFVDQRIAELLRWHDLVLGNIECVLSDAGRRENSLRRMHMRGRPSTCDLLSQWGVTVANVANNHILEQGRPAATDTVSNLKNANITVIGAGTHEQFGEGFSLVEKQIKGTSVFLGGICLRQERYAYNGGAGLSQVTAAVQELRNSHPRAVIVLSVHWGDEYMDYPSLAQRQTAKQLIDAGANCIIGHHPHVVQGLDWDERKLVAYSLGNFIFDGFAPATGWSFILSVTMQGRTIQTVETIPIERQNDFRPALADRKKAQRYQTMLSLRNTLCREPIDNPADYECDYQAKVRALCQSRRRNLWRALARRFFGFRPVFWPQLLFRPVQRRLGVW
ncbi:MAG: CapA family protein [Planctomycetaceae bacterium]|nr:CapA family protein [Planctomycetaceae bacterium]